MQILIMLDITADDQKASISVNPWARHEYQGTLPAGQSVEEAEAGREALGQAITFARMING